MIKDNHIHTLPEFGPDIPIFTKLYELYKIYSQYLILFPKSKKYTLGEKIDQIILSILELVIMTGYLPREQKLPGLLKISTKLDILKILLRLALETKCLDNNKYQHLVSQTIEIGKMLGGWIKTTR